MLRRSQPGACATPAGLGAYGELSGQGSGHAGPVSAHAVWAGIERDIPFGIPGVERRPLLGECRRRVHALDFAPIEAMNTCIAPAEALA